MKIVLSRKGVDSSAGGIPSPIMPDGTLVPLPIPSRFGPTSYDELSVNGHQLGSLVADLAGGKRLKPYYRCHLDPDLDEKSCARPLGWRPSFGQIEAAQVHLANQGIGPGDMFLFFGWFKQVEQSGGHWRYVRGAPDRHIIYGWLAVGEVVDLTGETECPPWLNAWRHHPHLNNMWDKSRNCLYLSAKRLTLHQRSLKGAGMFGKLNDSRILTGQHQGQRSVWNLPGWFHPDQQTTTLSYHEDARRWSRAGDRCTLKSVGRGQEFVINSNDQNGMRDWTTAIFADVRR